MTRILDFDGLLKATNKRGGLKVVHDKIKFTKSFNLKGEELAKIIILEDGYLTLFSNKLTKEEAIWINFYIQIYLNNFNKDITIRLNSKDKLFIHEYIYKFIIKKKIFKSIKLKNLLKNLGVNI